MRGMRAKAKVSGIVFIVAIAIYAFIVLGILLTVILDRKSVV
jgi:hypothetical protein